jgi:alpha-tubulin suppressor-like RCC1 family protein
VYAWGSNQEGQLGDGSTASSAVPLLVAGPSSQQRDGGLLQPVTAVACGARHSAAVNILGQCLAWGWNLHGQCGSGRANPSQPTPALVAALGPLKCTGVAAGMGHTVVCTDQGDVYAWGLNGDGQLGVGTDVSSLEVRAQGGGRQAGRLASRALPRVVATGSATAAGAAAVAANALRACSSSRCLPAHAAAHPAYILPLNAQLFPLPCALQPRLLEAAALADEQVSKVAAGSRHTLLLCASGKAFACGWGAFGQLGSGSFKSASMPQAVAVPAGAKVTDLAAGWWHSLFLAE